MLTAGLVGLSLIISGCVAAAAAGAAAGVGGYAWASGKLSFTTNNGISDAHAAAVSAFKDIEIEITRDEVSSLSGRLKGVAANGESVAVDLEPLNNQITKIDIRVGFWGNKYRESQIADAIQRHLH
jgi:hypothetical protein